LAVLHVGQAIQYFNSCSLLLLACRELECKHQLVAVGNRFYVDNYKRLSLAGQEGVANLRGCMAVDKPIITGEYGGITLKTFCILLV
jgi:hypothetical protein